MAGDDDYVAPEQKARQRIDAMLVDAGWVVQDYKAVNLYAATGVAVRELVTNAGPADYVDGDVHTLLRLPTGTFDAQGVKANVLFLDRKPGSDTPWTKGLWIYDLRNNKHFTLKTNTLTRADLDDFVACYQPGKRGKRVESDRFHRFTYDELVARDKASLDIFWLRDESLEDTDNLPPPGVIAAEIVDDLQAALAEFTELAESLQGIGVTTEE